MAELLHTFSTRSKRSAHAPLTPAQRAVPSPPQQLGVPSLTEAELTALRLRLEAKATGGRCAMVDLSALTVAELFQFHQAHAATFYPARRGTSEAQNFRDSARELLSLYSDLRALGFAPLHLKAIRLMMVESGLCRETINRHRIRRVKSIFAWGVEELGLPADLLARLRTVRPLRRGEHGVIEAPKKLPISVEQINAVLTDPKCPRVIRAMVAFQVLTGARPGEVCGCTGAEIDQNRSPWLWRPDQHKNAWRGQPRIIPIGPSAQLIVLPYLHDGILFPTKKRSDIGGKPYRPDNYREHVVDSCARTGSLRFSPNDLRHFRLTEVDSLADIDTAMEVAGHRDVRTTERYINRAGKRAMQFAQERG